jgi:pimeloyl-ACP methyl ester carboxylesterase
MGAGVALNLALRHTARVRALVLVRPAWLDRPLPAHLTVYPAIAYLLRTYGVEEGRRRFAASGAFAQILAESPDVAAALLGQFDAAQAGERVARLERIPLDCPCPDLTACQRLALPVLVLANRQDPIHPYDLAQRLAYIRLICQICGLSFDRFEGGSHGCSPKTPLRLSLLCGTKPHASAQRGNRSAPLHLCAFASLREISVHAAAGLLFPGGRT